MSTAVAEPSWATYWTAHVPMGAGGRSQYCRPSCTSGRISLYRAIHEAASARSSADHSVMSPPTPSTPCIATRKRKSSGARRPGAVVVPLDELDRAMVAQQRAQLIEDERANVAPGEVQDQLVAAIDRLTAFGVVRPVGVRAEEVAVGVDHFGLDPDAEAHAE